MKKSYENKSRIVYLDLIRIFATFAVMMLHVSSQNWYFQEYTSFNWKIFNMYDSLVRFSVPIFVMISGVFFWIIQKNYHIKNCTLKIFFEL